MTIAEGSIQDHQRDVLVLGIGNILWADEGFGSRAAEMFNQRYADIDGVECADGGTLGFYLINLITTSRRILVFDCCDFREKPGTMKVLRKDDIVIWLSTKISPHQTGLSDLLAQAEILGKAPEEIVGIQIGLHSLSRTGKVGSKPPYGFCLRTSGRVSWCKADCIYQSDAPKKSFDHRFQRPLWTREGH